MSFFKLSPRVGNRKQKPVTHVGRLYEQAMENKVVHTKGRAPKFRPSAFPLCSILIYRRMVMAASRGYFEEERSASSDFFTSVGTIAHENIQFHMGHTKQIFGDWKCINFGQCVSANDGMDLYDSSGTCIRRGKLTVRNSTDNICPSCGLAMRYEEKEIRFLGLVGHIDGIVKLPDGGYWLIDYKTTTKYKMNSGKLPVPSHLKQLPTYCYVVKKKYKLDVRGFSLIYFSRDNPFDFLESAYEWNGEWDKNIGKLIHEEKRKFVSGIEAFKKDDYKIAIRNKPCVSKIYYEKEMDFYDPCPMLHVCFNRDKLNRELRQLKRQFEYTEDAKNKLIELINL